MKTSAYRHRFADRRSHRLQGDISKGAGIKVHARLANGKPYDRVGDWRFVSNQVDQQTDTVAVRATFPTLERALLDGAFATVKVEEGAPPNSAPGCGSVQ